MDTPKYLRTPSGFANKMPSKRKSYSGRAVKKMIKVARKNKWPIRNQRGQGIPVSSARYTRYRVARLERMIETKEGCLKTSGNYTLPHNAVVVLQNNVGAVLNPLFTQQGTADRMEVNYCNRIGDRVTFRGISIRAMFENQLGRAKVHYRFMVIKCAKGDTIDRTTLFKGDANNKMLDVINTERFTIIAQKVFNVQVSNAAVTSAGITGAPTGPTAGQGTRLFKLWIPGRKFGRGGNVQYEDASSQPKFFDYRIVCLAYDWYGTPQDVNNVGMINELVVKQYYKDA